MGLEADQELTDNRIEKSAGINRSKPLRRESYKGKKMAGRMGSDTVTVKNLEVIEVTADGMLLIKGLVPGSVNSIVVVKKWELTRISSRFIKKLWIASS